MNTSEFAILLKHNGTHVCACMHVYGVCVCVCVCTCVCMCVCVRVCVYV